MQNKNHFVKLFVGNICNSIVHAILEKAINLEEIKIRYNKELQTSFEKAEVYRQKINPINTSLPLKDMQFIKETIIHHVKAELNSRILRGYKNINLSLIEPTTDDFLKKMKIM
ncbi:MAG: hypothetical protein Q7S33_00960 [Nanoarchaeota archaeon]|nr:hypothetical protein [Nanoarchaeota archaeon]